MKSIPEGRVKLGRLIFYCLNLMFSVCLRV
jgi:hypothetical protein